MLIDLTCPAEVFQAALPTEEMPAVSLALYNLSDRVIVSVEVTLRLLGSTGAEKERVSFRARSLNGRPHSTFRMNVPCPPCPSAFRADATVDKVWFSDNDCWRRESSRSVEYTPNELPVSPALTSLKFVAGENAVGFPSQQDGLWVCVCGRPNPDTADTCARCRQAKETVFARYNRDAVEMQFSLREKQLDLSTRNVREDTARMQRIREEEYNLAQRRKARRKRLLLCLPLCAAITAAILFAGAPGLRLWAANRAMERQDWRAAAETLRELGTFGGADAKLAECAWQDAKALAEKAETPEELRAAAEALRGVTGHPESLEMADEADLRRARAALDEKDPAAAQEALRALDEEDPRRMALENEIFFTEGKLKMAAGDYAKAREIFLTLSNVFPDAGMLAAECVYIPASAMIDEGRYEEAIAEMNRIPDHPQSRTAILECHYKMACAALENGDKQTAAAEFMMADEYGDAKDRMTETVYAMAEEALTAGDTAGAQTLFASLPGYAPAEEKNLQCILALAKEAMNSREYDRAAELLERLPEGYADAGELVPKATYLAGTAAMKNKEFDRAAALLERAGEYRDAKKQLQNALEQAARARLEAGDAAGALELFGRITDQEAIKKLKKEAEYLDAVAQAEAGGDPAALRARFEALGIYKEAVTWAKRMAYAEAEAAAAAGETLAAAKLYAAAGDWSDAAEKAAAQYGIYYGVPAEKAQQAMDSGEYAKAAALLEEIDRTNLPKAYAGIAELYDDACLKAGEALYQAGRPYEASAYFRKVKDVRRTQRWFSNACYRIIGKWADKSGKVIAEFREDSTCTIAGEEFTFLVSDSFTLKTEENGAMASSFRISSLTDTQLNLRDMREGHSAVYELRKQPGPPAAGSTPVPAPTPAPQAAGQTENAENTGSEDGSGPDSFAVKDGEP